ncbi:FAD-binding oxidoreductase [Pseudonocardia sp. C8]|uniref:FAD-binding oxidoreductase n=1 Tax=Pseudonocardia sp. C8 TaxID=2762759 RepID=UPI001642B778|nr:FAD-binding oxidoreductase [Pseudonocardia sp. C8]MBC3189547.1 FAD-binding oxidoreductase [Pseudonocardia sp. C8]
MATSTGSGARVQRLLSHRTLRPTTTTELVEALCESTSAQPQVTVCGAGTAGAWAEQPGHADLILDTTALSGVLTYNPSDMTVAVRAGTTLESLQAEVGEKRQRVAFDPARAGRGATVGGLLATADGGPARHAFGALRDHVIGVTVVLADGTVARSGGHVIKNVAGYDLTKLFSGSFGTLGVLSEIVLRLHPRPRATATVEVEIPRTDAFAASQTIAAAGIEPAAVELLSLNEPDSARLLLRFEGSPSGVSERTSAVRGLSRYPVHLLDEEEAMRRWAEVDAVCIGEPGDTVVRFGARPAAAATTTARLAAEAGGLGLQLESAGTLQRGVHTIRLRRGDAKAHTQLLRELHAAVGPACTVLRRDGLEPGASLWGPAPAAVALMRAVKQRFDPANRFGASRLAAWLSAPSTNDVATEGEQLA